MRFLEVPEKWSAERRFRLCLAPVRSDFWEGLSQILRVIALIFGGFPRNLREVSGNFRSEGSKQNAFFLWRLFLTLFSENLFRAEKSADFRVFAEGP